MKRKTFKKYRDPILLLGYCTTFLTGALFAKYPEWEKAFAAPISPQAPGIVATITDYVPVPRAPENLDEMFRFVFGDEAETAKKIAKCESGLRANARNVNTNGSVDSGLMQINSVHGVSERFLKDPFINLLVAKQIKDGRGNWSAWVCAKKVL